MKINEVVTLHPSVAAKSEYDRLLRAGKDASDDIIAYTMDDNNPEARRLEMLRHLDGLLGDVSNQYGPEDLEDFMHDQGDWKDNLYSELAKVEKGPKWNRSRMSDEEVNLQLAKDLKIPPYHLSVVDETEGEIPTGEYEICQRCGGEGCIECEEGLKDITGLHKALNLDDFPKGE